MDYNIVYCTTEKLHTPALVVGIYEDEKLSLSAQHIDKVSGHYLSKLITHGDFTGKIGQTLLLFALPGVESERVLLMGCGKKSEFNTNKLREAWLGTVKVLQKTGANRATACLLELKNEKQDSAQWARLIVETAEYALYHYDQTKSKKDTDSSKLEKISLLLEEVTLQPNIEQGITWGKAIGKGVKLARDLANLPGNICTPTYLADSACKVAQQYREQIYAQIINQDDMEKLGMGALLSVAKGSVEPPKFIILEYKGTKQDEQPIVLIGKGVTFDSGGISLKPADRMDEMKYDMSGAASVLGTIKACAELKLPIHMVGIIPSVENLPSGKANKPGDIVTSLDGKTIEVLNTDAEGRLILCDALTYSKRYHPKTVIDIATLTGACIIALGAHASGLLSNNQDLANQLIAAGEASGDRVWQLPLWEDYQSQLKSNFADIANVGGREAGTITAACFLARFTENLCWAHLDIAGTAWLGGKEKGATGRPVSLLTQYLIQCTQK
ncbi:leucyl aminopeptidase [Candidatus Nitrosacidococcus tergens]|uniref:Probable cytosol aminopeptidase n=1 Tax=Candidatus Nitrosacidococcus tergens TaxID=553981 RepID=A0A7G1Q948_9GAMM|nr:leucyl aminopeptidase [Candidatus Nitrosacidococcus tergens]CAB1275581.1 aminopeptidase A, a cyteinylglycinase [Candidatus Nitrosacidococcus tergens]